MITDEQKIDREPIQAMVRSIFTYAWHGLRFVRLKMPLPDETKLECILNQEDMDLILQLIKRGINRASKEKGEPVIFDRINDQPDPETQFYNQLFTIKADLMDRAKKEPETKELVQIIHAIAKLEDSKKRVNIRKVDLKLCVALAQHYDQTVTEEEVIDALQFIRERIGR